MEEKSTLETLFENSESNEANQTEVNELKNRLLYLQAEFDNYKRRAKRLSQQTIDNAVEKIFLDIIPTIDDLARAIKSNDNSLESIKNSLNMITKNLLSTVGKYGVTKYETSVGEKFDVEKHEAVALIGGTSDGEVAECIQDGYKMNNKVIRYAKVVVN